MIYVDDMRAAYGRLRLSHMIGDSDAELHAFADALGLARRHFQGDHYDIGAALRVRAFNLGARAITLRQAGAMMALRRRGLAMGEPETARLRLDAVKAQACAA